jgi:hypothetical protein
LWSFHPQVARNSLYALDMIDESFNWDKTEVKIIRNTDIQLSLNFNYRELFYSFSAIKIPNINQWDIQYSLVGKNNFKDGTNLFKRLESGEINNKVLAAALKCIKVLIKEKSPEYISFSSSDERLIMFYDVSIKYFEKYLHSKFIKHKLTKEEDGSLTKSWLFKIL